jgi:hypothetical protein
VTGGKWRGKTLKNDEKKKRGSEVESLRSKVRDESLKIQIEI